MGKISKSARLQSQIMLHFIQHVDRHFDKDKREEAFWKWKTPKHRLVNMPNSRFKLCL